MYVAESKHLTHQGAKKMMATVIDMANQTGIAISCAIVDAGGHMVLLERMDRRSLSYRSLLHHKGGLRRIESAPNHNEGSSRSGSRQ